MRYPTCVTPSPGCDALKLSKALHGLSQAGRLWWKELGGKLEQLGLSKLHSDWGLYVRTGSDGLPSMMLLVCVDDFVIAFRSKADIAVFLSEVQKFWKLSTGSVSRASRRWAR